MNSEIAVGSAVAPAWVSADGKISVFYGDCKTVMAALPQECVHAVISDPPYGMSPDGISRNMDEIEGMKTRGGFAGAEWDAAVPGPSIWREALRVAKPGAHLLSFASTRTYHTMATAAQVAGWRIRDMLSWVYCQGTPKGMDVGKAYDRQAGVEEQRGYIPVPGGIGKDSKRSVIQFKGKREGMYLNPDNPISPEAKKWHGWNTALKTAVEPIAMARKPYDGSLLDNLREHSVGALNTKLCAIPCETPVAAPSLFDVGEEVKVETYWPANFLVSREAAQWLNEWHNQDWTGIFYTPKPTDSEFSEGYADDNETVHLTVKPLALMRYLIQLVTPPDCVVLDPFGGSGTTAVACQSLGRRCIIIERERKSVDVIIRRLATPKGGLF